MPIQPPVFFVIGSPQHGKTTARNMLAELTYLRGASCSDLVYKFLAKRRGVTEESLRQLPKEGLRPALMAAGDFLVGDIPALAETAKDDELDHSWYRIPSSLIRTLYLSGVNVIDGVRRRTELTHAKDHLDWNGVRSLTVWIDRPGHPLIVDNTDLTSADADVTVANDGTLDDLRDRLAALLELHFGVQGEVEPITVVDLPPAKSVPAKPVNEL